jgi:hypothetical protein
VTVWWTLGDKSRTKPRTPGDSRSPGFASYYLIAGGRLGASASRKFVPGPVKFAAEESLEVDELWRELVRSDRAEPTAEHFADDRLVLGADRAVSEETLRGVRSTERRESFRELSAQRLGKPDRVGAGEDVDRKTFSLSPAAAWDKRVEPGRAADVLAAGITDPPVMADCAFPPSDPGAPRHTPVDPHLVHSHLASATAAEPLTRLRAERFECHPTLGRRQPASVVEPA